MLSDTHYHQHPRRWAISEPERPAIVMGGTGETTTYGALDAAANRCAYLLRSLGLKRGDHVALLIENHPHFLEIVWAAQNAGLYFTPISWRFRAEEVAFILADCGAKALFYTRQQADLVAGLRTSARDVAFVAVDFTDAGSIDYAAATHDLPATPIPDESRGSDMVYSSGSTGRPKGVQQQLPTQSIDGLSPMFAIYADRYGWGEDTVYLMTAPIYHSGPLRFAMAMSQVGATLVLMEKFDARASLALVERYRVTHAHWVPTMLVRLLKLPKAERDAFDVSSVRIVIHGAAPIAPEVKYQALDWLGPILEESYGGTEGNGLTMITSAEWLAHPGSVGRPFLGAIEILDEEGRVLAPGEIGTVWFSGGPKFAYHNNPEKTASAYDAAGRSTLGDIGYLDGDGYLYLTDRKDNMIISGGVNVFPQEAENALISHPEIADAAVFGVPHGDFGEVLHAVVQPVMPGVGDAALEARLIAHCKARLATLKCPRTIAFSDALPRHDTGKIYVRLLKQEWLDHAAAARVQV